jgi:hypothetical protein
MSAQEEEARNRCQRAGGYPKGKKKTPFLANKAVTDSEPLGQRCDRKIDDERGGQAERVSMKEKRGNKVRHEDIQEHGKGISHKEIGRQTLLSKRVTVLGSEDDIPFLRIIHDHTFPFFPFFNR